MQNYIVTESAEADILEILLFIADDNRDAAISLFEKFNKHFELLARMPEAGRIRDDLIPGLRSFPEGNYLIYYKIFDDQVAIIRVIHSARDIDEIFS